MVCFLLLIFIPIFKKLVRLFEFQNNPPPITGYPRILGAVLSFNNFRSKNATNLQRTLFIIIMVTFVLHLGSSVNFETF